jgi:hypothetical protein
VIDPQQEIVQPQQFIRDRALARYLRGDHSVI